LDLYQKELAESRDFIFELYGREHFEIVCNIIEPLVRAPSLSCVFQ
jgi:hypothetical protein